MAYFRPTFVSERERAETWVDGKTKDDSRWEDCGPCAVVMAVDATTNGKQPAVKSLDECERLRLAAGYGALGGTNIQRLAAAAVIRYHIKLPRYVSGASAILTALRPGYGAAVAGSLAAFGPAHPLSVHAPYSNATHAVYIQCEEDGKLWWMDPLGPVTGYRGTYVAREAVRAFLSQGIAAATVIPLVKVP